MSTIDEGQVELKLLDREGEAESLYLKPTIGSVRKISRQFGDIDTAFRRVIARNFDAVCYIVFEGLQVTEKKAQGRLEDRIYRTGVAEVAANCVEYLGVLQNGGRPLKEADPEDADESAEGNE